MCYYRSLLCHSVSVLRICHLCVVQGSLWRCCGFHALLCSLIFIPCKNDKIISKMTLQLCICQKSQRNCAIVARPHMSLLTNCHFRLSDGCLVSVGRWSESQYLAKRKKNPISDHFPIVRLCWIILPTLWQIRVKQITTLGAPLICSWNGNWHVRATEPVVFWGNVTILTHSFYKTWHFPQGVIGIFWNGSMACITTDSSAMIVLSNNIFYYSVSQQEQLLTHLCCTESSNLSVVLRGRPSTAFHLWNHFNYIVFSKWGENGRCVFFNAIVSLII